MSDALSVLITSGEGVSVLLFRMNESFIWGSFSKGIGAVCFALHTINCILFIGVFQYIVKCNKNENFFSLFFPVLVLLYTMWVYSMTYAFPKEKEYDI